MKTIYLFSILLTLFALSSVSAQTRSTTSPSFPGVSQVQLTMLREVKRAVPFALPMWLPDGFKLEDIHARLGSDLEIYERELVLVYLRPMPNGKLQRFALEAGFDGIGDLPYDEAKVIKASVGDIYLVYEPNDLENSRVKIKDYVMTQWFNVGDVAYHYDGMYDDEDKKNLQMISISDTEKILASLREF